MVRFLKLKIFLLIFKIYFFEKFNVNIIKNDVVQKVMDHLDDFDLNHVIL